ncbi:unnamed protein product [Rhizophagus irregularis]|nr:unnamed protein product [Rhizophagus irregularis]
MKPDFKTRRKGDAGRIGWASEEWKNLKIRSSGLPKIRKRRTKVLGVSSVFQRTEKTKIRFGWASEVQKTQRFIRTVSDGFPKNGKRRTFIKIHLGFGWISKERKKGTKIHSGGFLKNGKRNQDSSRVGFRRMEKEDQDS